MRERLAFFISGNGSTMAAIINACQLGKIPIDIALVYATEGAKGIEKAKKLGVRDIIVVNPDDFRKADTKIDYEAWGRTIQEALKKQKTTMVILNGYLYKIPQNVISAYKGRIFNQHPAPVPEFGGRGMIGRAPHEAVLEFQRLSKRVFPTKAVIQHVHEKYDLGSVVAAKDIPILPNDTAETLKERVLPVEHALQITFLKTAAKGDTLEGMQNRSLVAPEEEHLLVEAKKRARLRYPNG